MDKLDNINKAIYDQYRAVVLCANFSDCNQVLTIIKSIVFHNRFIKFYVINSDFPTEWFVSMRKKLAKLDCQIVNARVSASLVSNFKTDISAEEDTTILLIRNQKLKSIIDKNIEAKSHIYELLNNQMAQILTLMQNMLFNDLNTRLSDFLAEIYEKNN